MTDVANGLGDGLEKQDRLESWLDMHKKGQQPWHCQWKHPYLEDKVEVLFGDSGKKHKVLIPMCGKAVELSWFAELGHSVVGIEASIVPIEEFFSDNNFQYSVEGCEQISGQLYKAEGVDIKIYCCDIFNFTKNLESEFDVIWDRGAFGAVDPSDRRQYATLMSSLMTSACCYLSVVNYYGDKAREEAGLPPTGPPHVIHLDQVQDYFAPSCSVELLEKRPKEEQKIGGKPVSQEVAEFIYKISKC
ncbi:Thiopurine S-methyltransferase [Lamellibrachia satsuma]|nr:Thiopurine S-methyltransferase [Lamellibrachia satsuma]